MYKLLHDGTSTFNNRLCTNTLLYISQLAILTHYAQYRQCMSYYVFCDNFLSLFLIYLSGSNIPKYGSRLPQSTVLYMREDIMDYLNTRDIHTVCRPDKIKMGDLAIVGVEANNGKNTLYFHKLTYQFCKVQVQYLYLINNPSGLCQKSNLFLSIKACICICHSLLADYRYNFSILYCLHTAYFKT